MEKNYLNILLVDNDEQCLQAYIIALEPGNFRCITATDPLIALQLYKELYNTKNKIDVIISDHFMPGMSGIELLAHLKEFDASVKVIIVTAFSDTLVPNAELASNAYAIFPKPLHFQSLVSVLQKIGDEQRSMNDM